MTSPGQSAYVDYLRANFIGPKGGPDEILHGSPVYAYLSGMLFPVEEGEGVAPDTLDEDLLPGETPLDELDGGQDPSFSPGPMAYPQGSTVAPRVVSRSSRTLSAIVRPP